MLVCVAACVHVYHDTETNGWGGGVIGESELKMWMFSEDGRMRWMSSTMVISILCLGNEEPEYNKRP